MNVYLFRAKKNKYFKKKKLCTTIFCINLIFFRPSLYSFAINIKTTLHTQPCTPTMKKLHDNSLPFTSRTFQAHDRTFKHTVIRVCTCLFVIYDLHTTMNEHNSTKWPQRVCRLIKVFIKL